MTRRHSEEAAIGEDAFLDTIANLVGILIILVVIVGSKSYATAKIEIERELKQKVDQLDSPVTKSKNLELDLLKQAEELHGYDAEVIYRDSERMAIMDRVTMAERLLEEELQNLDQASKERLESEQEMGELEKQLSILLEQQGNIQSTETTTAVLQHLPTPMAKTVFGREVHVMMRGNRVAVIPWDRLIETLKVEARRAAERNSQKERVVNQLGPIDGFLMTYGLKSQSGIMSNGSSARLARTVELEKFELEPTPEVHHETVLETLSTGGRLRLELASSVSKQTTVTVGSIRIASTNFAF